MDVVWGAEEEWKMKVRLIGLVVVMLVGTLLGSVAALAAEAAPGSAEATPAPASAEQALPAAPAATGAAPAAAPTAEPLPGYAVRLGDRIQLSVWGEPSLSTEATVMPDGTVSLPMIGALAVVGKTIPAATQEVQDAYGRYFKDPKVSLTCLPKSPSQVYMAGAVARPGPLDYDPRLRMTDYLAMAGGPTVGADLTRVVITSVEASGTSTKTLDLSQTKPGQETEQNPTLKPGDTVWVGPALPVAVVGAVTRPGSFEYQQGLRLSDYLGLAGGPTDYSNLGAVSLKHAGPEPVQTMDLKKALAEPDNPQANPVLRAGDVVTVPTKFVGGTLGWSDILGALTGLFVWFRR